MEKNVPPERNKYRKTVFSNWENFENNMDDQKVKTLVSAVTTQSLCVFMYMIKNNVITLKYILK